MARIGLTRCDEWITNSVWLWKLPYPTMDGTTCQTPISMRYQDSIGAILVITCWTLGLHNWLAGELWQYAVSQTWTSAITDGSRRPRCLFGKMPKLRFQQPNPSQAKQWQFNLEWFGNGNFWTRLNCTDDLVAGDVDSDFSVQATSKVQKLKKY